MVASKYSFKKGNFILNGWSTFKKSCLSLLATPLRTCLTLAIIAVSLAVPMTFYVLFINAHAVTAKLNDSCQISLYLKKDVSQEQISRLISTIQDNSYVRKVTFISREEGLAEFSRISGFAEPIKYLAENPLPDVLEIIPGEDLVRDQEKAEELLYHFTNLPEVDQGKFDLMWVKRLEGIGKLLRNLGLSMGIMLLLGVVLTVSNTVRINVMIRRDEIAIMKLFGATDSFIARPYIYAGIILGLLGGLFAWWLNEFFVLCATYIINELANLYGEKYDLVPLSFFETAVVIMISIFLSVIATRLSLLKVSKDAESI